MKDQSLEGFQIVHFGDKNDGLLREKRVTLGLTQQEVADRADIKLQQYQKLESGERNIRRASFDLACRVIEALGMNISDFFHDKYILGEEVYWDSDGVKYVKTGKLIEEDVE